MRLSGLLSLLDDLPEFGQLTAAARAAAPGPSAVPPVAAAGAAPDSQRAALPAPAVQAVVREAAKPFLVAG
jgi:hypothetical protein